MKTFSPWNCTSIEKIEFLKSNPFPQTIKNQNRLNELDEVFRQYGTALPIIRILDEIQEVVREYDEEEEGNLGPAFKVDIRIALRLFKNMFLNIQEIDQSHPDNK